MVILFVNKFRYRYRYDSSSIPTPRNLGVMISIFHTSSLSPITKSINWNTTHSFVRENPLLSILERCKSLVQLKQIQAQMVLTGLIENGFAASRLVAFCALSESKELDYCTRLLY